jgi:hypothetical protein
MAVFEHEGLGLKLVLRDLTQAQAEAFASEMFNVKLPTIVYAGKTLRAALRGGWVAEPPWSEGSVMALPPRIVLWASERVSDHYREALSIPNGSSSIAPLRPIEDAQPHTS